MGARVFLILSHSFVDSSARLCWSDGLLGFSKSVREGVWISRAPSHGSANIEAIVTAGPLVFSGSPPIVAPSLNLGF